MESSGQGFNHVVRNCFITQVVFHINKAKFDHVSSMFEIIMNPNCCFCELQLILPATVPPAGQPKPVWKHDDEQLHGWPRAGQRSRSRTNGPDARTEAGPDGHEPHGDGKNAHGS